MVGDDVVTMPFEEIHLLLQLAGVGPVVVALAIGDVLAGRAGEQPRAERHSEAELVLRLVDRFDDAGIARRVIGDDRGGGVGRGVVVDDHLEGEIRFLLEKALQRLPNEGRMIVGEADDAQQRFGLAAPALNQGLLALQFHFWMLAW